MLSLIFHRVFPGLLILHLFFPCRLPATPAQTNAWRESAMARAQLHLARARLAERQFTFDTTPQAELAVAVRAFHAATNSVPPTPQTGILLDAYIAQNDGAPQPFYRHLPSTWTPEKNLPLLVYLHGFVPSYSLLEIPKIPLGFTNLAERAGVAIAVPFGRSNTDFQGVGEQDVFNVIEHMARRYNVDTNRVVLAGYSMGGMGAWQLASRWPNRFNAFLAVGNRGDFYAWHSVDPATLPAWQRRIIDTQFAAKWTVNLQTMPILAIHGESDFLMPAREAHAIFDRVKSNPNAQLILLANTTHPELGAQFTNETVHAWLEKHLKIENSKLKIENFRPLLAIGPDGGWTPDELARFLDAGFQPFSLGERPLRTDTACVALLATLHYLTNPQISKSPNS